MKLGYLVAVVCMLPGLATAASRTEAARVGVGRGGGNVMRSAAAKTETSETADADVAAAVAAANELKSSTATASESESTTDCREAYRACMDQFCLMDESEGERCACSSNIEKSKALIKEIQSIQAEADTLYTEGVEREQLGAKVNLVFGESEQAQESAKLSGVSLADWLAGNGSADGTSLGNDVDIGDGLYDMASEYCASELESCPSKADMEESLYVRQIVTDCKAFESYLTDQKTNANANKRTAEAAVRKARLEMLDTTNKYNRGECLLAYRACISDKGGCGVNFENCLDADLLGRRANACENVLDQCLAVRTQVLADWQDESKAILAQAAQYADKNQRATCLARIQVCLEDGCSTATNSACLSNINVAAGVCPVINECEEMIPGIKDVIKDKLGFLQTQFCQNDIDKCLRDKCGENFNSPECLGKKTKDIVAMCPQSMYPSCKNETQFDIIVQAVLLQMDYQMMQGCINYFSEQLGNVCGTDMSCLPENEVVVALTAVPSTTEEWKDLDAKVKASAEANVDEFFKKFEKEATISACKSAQKPKGGKGVGDTVFETAKNIAYIGAENRALREMDKKVAELSRTADLKVGEERCYSLYKVGSKTKSSQNYSYISSVNFEPATGNCHVCRVQHVCETGGEKKATSALKAAAGGLSAGAAMGTQINAGWGTAIGAVIGAVGAGALGAASGGKEDFCQEHEACEDNNIVLIK